MKLSILYYSATGNTARAAAMIADGIRKMDGIEVNTYPIDNIDKEFVKESGCVILGTPVIYTGMAAPVKTWLDTTGMELKLGGKIGGAFATAAYVHGNAGTAIEGILNHMMVMGMMPYSGGAAHGNPIIQLGPVGIAGDLENYREYFELYGQRMAVKTKELDII